VLDYFCIEERGSSIGREIRAGVVTFLTMSYILLVNPQILSQVGYNPDQVGRKDGRKEGREGVSFFPSLASKSAASPHSPCFSPSIIPPPPPPPPLPLLQVVVATALSSGVASMIAGVCGNLPFGLAPGTGLSVYLAYGLVMAGVMSKEEGMAACLFSGVLMGEEGGREGVRN